MLWVNPGVRNVNGQHSLSSSVFVHFFLPPGGHVRPPMPEERAIVRRHDAGRLSIPEVEMRGK